MQYRKAKKLAGCVRLARECSRNSWQETGRRADYLQIKREAMADARYWRHEA